MSERVRITEVGPRDGLQNEPGVIAASNKIRLIELLMRTGVDEIELTSFVSPRWVPQLADAEEVLEGVRDLVGKHRHPVFSVLAPNMRGFERAVAIHELGFPLKLALFAAASETFSRKNTNASIDDSIRRLREVIPEAVAAGMPLRLYISCAVACPYEGDIEPRSVRAVADRLLEAVKPERRAAVDLDLGDTIGRATPDQIDALLDAFDDLTPQLTLHLHDTLGQATSCVERGLDRGVRSFDGSVAGLGGCPFASTPQNRAPGNIATGRLVDCVEAAGYETGIDREDLAKAATFATRIVEAARRGGGGGTDA
ncbi:MAG: hydroxymethylglutaryl-CoA lyase [Phycisphaerales bacterium]